MNLSRALELLLNDAECDAHANELVAQTKAENLEPTLEENADHRARMAELLTKYVADEQMIARILDFTQRRSEQETDKATYQAMEALIHNLNTMNSRAGAQVPFSSINYGMDVSPEGRLVMKNVLLATEAGLGGGETPIFPIQISASRKASTSTPATRTTTSTASPSVRAQSACSRTSPSWTRRSTSSTTSPAIRRPKSPTWAAAPA